MEIFLKCVIYFLFCEIQGELNSVLIMNDAGKDWKQEEKGMTEDEMAR